MPPEEEITAPSLTPSSSQADRTSTTTTATPQRPASRPAAEMSALTGLRGIAALTVLIAHSRYFDLLPALQPLCLFFEWHGLAVDLFFMLSGFVLIHVYKDRAEMKTWAGWRKYAIARVARIVPIYLVTLIATLLLFVIGSIILKKWPPFLSAPVIITNFLLLQNWPGFFRMSINLASWSLSVEFLCYVLLMPLALAWYRRPPLWLAGLLVIALLAGRSLLPDEVFDWVSVGRGLLCFPAGVLLHRFYQSRPGRGIAAATVFGALAFLGLRSSITWGGLPPNLLLISFPFLLLGLASTADTWVYRFFTSRIMLWLGDISFSLYLWQGPLMLVTLFKIRPLLHSQPVPVLALWTLLEIAFPLWLSTYSYRLIEVPMRDRLRKLLSRDRPA